MFRVTSDQQIWFIASSYPNEQNQLIAFSFNNLQRRFIAQGTVTNRMIGTSRKTWHLAATL